MADKRIDIEVAYALPHEQRIVSLKVASDCDVEQAIQQSGILDIYPQIDLSTDKVGIFGKLCKLNGSLRDKDRIEIYRKLIADPKQSRRQKAEMQRQKTDKTEKPKT